MLFLDETLERAWELVALTEEKNAPHWKAFGMMNEGWLTGSALA
jgi:hypothetical protein